MRKELVFSNFPASQQASLTHLHGRVVEHLLPRIVKLPVLRVSEEPLLGQRYRLLGRGVYATRPLVVRRGTL